MLLFVLEKDAQDSAIAGPHLYSHPYEFMIAEHLIRSPTIAIACLVRE
jgi:hypothetical protein